MPAVGLLAVDKCRSMAGSLSPWCIAVCAGKYAQGVARSGFPRAVAAQMLVLGGDYLSALRACSRALMRFLATALLCRKRWLSLPVSTMWQ